MRLLDRYLLRELCPPLFYCISGFLIFWITFDLFAELEELQRAQMTAAEIASYYLVRTPELLVTILPIALLLALLYALANHGRHNELLAMRAAGLSLTRISVPYLAVGFAASSLLFYLNENLVSDSTARAQALKTRHVDEAAQGKEWIRRVNFRNARESRIWNIGAFNRQTYDLVEPHVEWLLPDGTKKQLIAKRAGWTNEQWTFFDVELFSYEPNVDFDKAASRPLRTNILVMPQLHDTPEEIQLQLKFQRMDAVEAAKRTQLTLGEIRYLRDHMELNKRDRALLETQLHARLAQPWTCMVVVLVAVGLGARANSRRNVLGSVASSIFIVLVYFFVLRVGLALGTGGYVAPWVAAWSPNAIFTAIGMALARGR
jgi:lipopolysaccharide export system permease protein